MTTETPGILIDNKTLDNKLYVQETSRPMGTQNYFTSQGDSTSNPLSVGGGEFTAINHLIGDPMEQFLTIDFNVKENRSYMHEGYIMWDQAYFDTLTMSIVPKLTTVTPASDTFFNVYGGYLVVPAPGTGTVNIQEMNLVEMPVDMDIGKRPEAFWDADYDSTSHQFDNLRPAVNELGQGIGQYNMFTYEIEFLRFVNNFMLLNNGFIMLQSADSAEIGHNMRIKFKINTRGEDHAWKAACAFTMHRVKTC